MLPPESFVPTEEMRARKLAAGKAALAHMYARYGPPPRGFDEEGEERADAWNAKLGLLIDFQTFELDGGGPFPQFNQPEVAEDAIDAEQEHRLPAHEEIIAARTGSGG